MGEDLAAGVQNLDESQSSAEISTLIVIVQPKSQH